MRVFVRLGLVVIVILSAHAVFADLAITIHTDEVAYESGDTIEVSLSAQNYGEAVSVDVYVGLLTPDGIYATHSGEWSDVLEPWIADIHVPADFTLDRAPLWWFELPSTTPPIGEPGDYAFAAVLTLPGTFEWASELSLAPFAFSTGTSTDINMISIPAGSFLMGSPDVEEGRFDDEGPQRTVHVSAFSMSETEVTQEQWEGVMGWCDSYFSGDDHPVEAVSWYDCVSFCNNLSEADGYTKCYTMTHISQTDNHIWSATVTCDFGANGYRLPTEAEWEHACRAGSTSRYYWGDSSEESVMKQFCWYEKNASENHWTDPHADQEGTQPVGQKMPNAFGLFDMSGNLFEWCWDRYSSDHYRTRPDPDVNPTGPETGSERVIHGGSFLDRESYCRSAYRYGEFPGTYFFANCGFRIVRSE